MGSGLAQLQSPRLIFMILLVQQKPMALKNYFIVTPLLDQQKIVSKLLDFWQTGGGVEYNASRHDAVKQVELKDSLDAAIAFIEQKEGVKADSDSNVRPA